jgi:N-acetylneuraminic acid mutarotase
MMFTLKFRSDLKESAMGHFIGLMPLRIAGAFGLTLAVLVATPAQSQTVDPKGRWSSKASLPAARNEVAGVAFNGKFYVIGGAFAREKYDVAVNEEYDPTSDRWRLRAPMPAGLNHPGAAVLDGKIYVAGGFTGNQHRGVDDSVFAYDVAADTWQKLPPLSSPRGSVGLAALGGKIHAVSGRINQTDPVATHQVYDPATGRWSVAAPLPKARDHFAAMVAVDGKLHAIGGRFGANEDNTGLHDVYDPVTNAWTSAPPLPTPRSGGAGVLYGDLIVALGGEADKDTYNENEAYDVKAAKWLTLKPMPSGLHGFGAGVIGRQLYVATGAKGRGGRDVTAELLMFSLP